MFVFKLILIYTIFQYLRNWKLKKKPTVLCCGLFCFVGKEIPDPFKLKILALYNQSRGEDATGVCVDNVISKDVIKAGSFFFKYPDALDFNNYPMKNHAVLGHCRKASMNYNKDVVNYAHPHKAEIDGKDFLRLIHNGSLTNCFDLAKKYNTTYTDKSDSMLLAEILTMGWKDQNMDVLKEYEGSATIIFYPVNTIDTLYVHRDKQRELFYWKESKEACYISSIPEALVAIGAAADEVQEFEEGILNKFVGGKITKTWDLKDKTPYLHYKQKQTNFVQVNKAFQANRGKKKAPKSSEGFYWEDHRIMFNGHAYTGELYVHNGGGESKKHVTKETRANYTIYFVIMGLIMKTRTEYETLYKESCRNNDLDAVKFNSFLLSKLQKHTMFPILGKTYADRPEVFFWSEETRKLLHATDEYSWSPPLSGKTFKIDKSGHLKSEQDNEKPVTGAKVIEDLIDMKVLKNETYKSITDLYSDYKKTKGLDQNFNTFVDHIIKVFSESEYVTRTQINYLDTLRDNEKYNWTQNDGYNILHSVSEVLSEMMGKMVDHLHEFATSDVTDENSIDQFISEQVVDDMAGSESEYYKEQSWKDDVLFGDYENLEDVLTNYLQTDEPQYIKPLYKGICNIFVDLGMMTTLEMTEITAKSEISAKHVLGRLFDSLKEDKALKYINELFKSGMITDGFVKLHDDYQNLCAKHGLSEKEKLRFTILKIGLKYIMRKANSLDKEKLEKEHKITAENLEQICS